MHGTHSLCTADPWLKIKTEIRVVFFHLSSSSWPIGGTKQCVKRNTAKKKKKKKEAKLILLLLDFKNKIMRRLCHNKTLNKIQAKGNIYFLQYSLTPYFMGMWFAPIYIGFFFSSKMFTVLPLKAVPCYHGSRELIGLSKSKDLNLPQIKDNGLIRVTPSLCPVQTVAQ